MFIEDEMFDPCHMYQLIIQNGTCLATTFDKSTIVDCDEFVYDTSIFTETLTTKLDLVESIIL